MAITLQKKVEIGAAMVRLEAALRETHDAFEGLTQEEGIEAVRTQQGSEFWKCWAGDMFGADNTLATDWAGVLWGALATINLLSK